MRQLTEEQAEAARASHELRTPLTAVRLAIEELAQWPEAEGAVADQLQVCLREVDRLSGAITTFLKPRPPS